MTTRTRDDRHARAAQAAEILRSAPTQTSSDLDWAAIEQRTFAELDRLVVVAKPGPLASAAAWWREFSAPRPVVAWSMAVATVCVCLAATALLLPRSLPNQARIVQSRGAVSRDCGGGSGVWAAPVNNGTIAANMCFRTDAHGFVTAEPQSAALVALMANSSMTFRTVNNRNVKIALDRGSVAVDLTPRNEPRVFTVTTPNAECVALGTVFQVEVFGADNGTTATVLTVQKGSVRMSGASEETVVDAGFQVAMVGDSLGDPLPVTEPQILNNILHAGSAPQPSVSPAHPTGCVQVASQPAGGVLLVDGALQGVTPLTITVGSGMHRFEVSWDARKSWILDTVIAAGDTLRLTALAVAHSPSLTDSPTAGTGSEEKVPAVPTDRVADPTVTDTTPAATVSPVVDTARAAQPAAPGPAPRPSLPSKLRTGARSAVSGTGRRISGQVQPAILRLACTSLDNPWSEDAAGQISKFVNDNSDLDLDPNWQAIAFEGVHRSFEQWLRTALRRGPSQKRALSMTYPEQDALELLAYAAAYVNERDFPEYRSRVAAIVQPFLDNRFGIRLDLSAEWIAPLKKAGVLLPWEEEYLAEARTSYNAVRNEPRPRGKEVQGIYRYLRMCHLMRYPILFCEPRGSMQEIPQDHVRLLRTYVNNGGTIYFTAGIDESWSTRGGILQILGEKVRDSLGTPRLEKMQRTDRLVTGFGFPGPKPAIFHPWTCFPLTVPQTIDVEIAIFTNTGSQVFADTIRSLTFGSYERRSDCYRWRSVDNAGGEVPSGFYICQVQSGLYKETYPLRVSSLRRLIPGRHPVFKSFFEVSDVPSSGRRAVENLPYDEPAVFGVTRGGRLAICYSEAHSETELLQSEAAKGSGRESALRWLTNVVVHSLGEGSLARPGR